MEVLSIIEIWKYLKWLPKFILRKLFSKDRLADLVLIDVQARHEAVRANLGDIASYSLHFQIINMSPFDIELDRAEIDFLCAGTSVSKQYIKKSIFKAGEVGGIYVKGEIETPKAIQMARHYKDNRSSISIHCEFNCSLHNFTKVCNNLEGVNVHFTNAEWRESTLENA
ncbi:hypothetical protein ACCI51_04085 [Microbulbifer echini]|uniref:Uncharacterized protein n=1 Tax=Microbulbifer echini TaxID=1529067 RepID=A0ABV4NJV5_9GAMM